MGVQVGGHTEASDSLRQAADDLADLDLDTIADDAGRVVTGLVPVRTGRARRNVRVSASNARAVVTVAVPYARFIKYRFAARADAVMEARAPALIENEWDTIAERHDLT